LCWLWFPKLGGKCLRYGARTRLSERWYLVICCLGLLLALLHAVHDTGAILLVLLCLLPRLLWLVFLSVLLDLTCRDRSACRVLHTLREVVQLLRVVTCATRCLRRRGRRLHVVGLSEPFDGAWCCIWTGSLWSRLLWLLRRV
jgi:hypothetical protein